MMDIKVSVEDYGMGLRVVIGSGVNEYLLVPDDALALAERIIAHTRAALVNVDKKKSRSLQKARSDLVDEYLGGSANVV